MASYRDALPQLDGSVFCSALLDMAQLEQAGVLLASLPLIHWAGKSSFIRVTARVHFCSKQAQHSAIQPVMRMGQSVLL
jgi:hypothetical protein